MRYYFLFFCLLVVCKSDGQSNKKGFGLYVKGGYSLCNMIGSGTGDETFLNTRDYISFYANHPQSNVFRSGITFGIGFEYNFSSIYALLIDINYAPKGCKINANKIWEDDLDDFIPVEGNVIWKQNYVTIPVTNRFRIWKGMYLSAGVYLGILVESIEIGNVNISDVNYAYERDRRAVESDFGIVAGTGFKHVFTKRNSLSMDIRGNWSTISQGKDYIPRKMQSYVQVFELTFVYCYHL